MGHSPPRRLEIDEQAAFISQAIGSKGNLLEVGCGSGGLALRLASPRRRYVALDRKLPEPLPAALGVEFVQSDFLLYPGKGFDALMFTASLHHLSPLEEALDQAKGALGPNGLLVIDDFDLEAPDAATVGWYYQLQDRLAAEGKYDPSQFHSHDDHHRHHHHDPLERWRGEHHHHGEAPLHTGAAMLDAIGKRFEVASTERGPYLYRYICAGLAPDAEGDRLAASILAEERERISRGELKAVGLRVLASNGAIN